MSNLWISIDEDEYAKRGDEYLHERIAHYRAENDETAAQYRAAAQDEYRHREGDIEVDDDACVSMGGDAGAYVHAWVWIDDADADIVHCHYCDAPIPPREPRYSRGDTVECGACREKGQPDD